MTSPQYDTAQDIAHDTVFDLALTYATRLTADATGPVWQDATRAIKGRIAWIGASVRTPMQSTRPIDASGKVITPSFVNVHTHAILSMVRGVAADFGLAPPCAPERAEVCQAIWQSV